MLGLGLLKRRFALIVICVAAETALNAQTFTTLFDFDNDRYGAYPEYMSLIQGVDGDLYGTTLVAGPYGTGSVFKVDRREGLDVIYLFSQPFDAPEAGLVQGTDFDFYGTAEGEEGSVFEVTAGGGFRQLYIFCRLKDCEDGSTPFGALIQGWDGNFYGVTATGGDPNCTTGGPQYYGCGTVFAITPQGSLTTFHIFKGTDGAIPYSRLLQAADGNLYGTTPYGGDFGCGTIFAITRGGHLTTLHAFQGADGCNPFGGLIQALDGNLYGTTSGTIFKIALDGTFSVLYTFCVRNNCIDGSSPYDNLIQATDGNFYGTTTEGGANGDGTIFALSPDGVLTTLHSFDKSDGQYPLGGLLQATNGRMYGTTSRGGFDYGTLFRLDMGLAPFVSFMRNPAKIGQSFGILGQTFAKTTAVSLNGIPANFTVVSGTFIRASVPAGATTGYVTVTTPSGTLTSNVPFQVIP